MEQNKRAKKDGGMWAIWVARFVLIGILSLVASSPLWGVYYLFSEIICINTENGWCFGLKGCLVIYSIIYLWFVYMLILRKRVKQ